VKPDPHGALEIAAGLGIPPAEFIYLGDTNTDMRTALAAGMHPVGALWGFRDEEELRAAGARALLRHPADLLRLAGSDQARTG
jgi:phosphoglycolate phosphatase